MKICAKKAESFASSIRYSKDGLIPVVAASARGGEVLMLAYANREAVARTLRSGRAWFFSRERGRLWEKGESSGNLMAVRAVLADCDNDALIYGVEMLGRGDACHLGRKSCFVQKFGAREKPMLAISALAAIIEQRVSSKSSGSYTAKLASSQKLACAKIAEEAAELVEAIQEKGKQEVVWETCDLIYHALVAARARGVRLPDLEREFGRRHLQKVSGQ